MQVFSTEECKVLRQNYIANKPPRIDWSYFESTYRKLLQTVFESGSSPADATIATDALCVWFQRAALIADKHSIDVFDSKDDSDKLFYFILDFWTDSGAAFGNSLKDLFSKLLILLQKIIKPVNNLDDKLHGWISHILKFPSDLRVRYWTLELLTKYVDGNVVFQTDPMFCKEALSLMGSNALANPIGRCLVSICASKRSTVNVAQDVVSPTIDELISNDFAREHIFLYFMKPLLRSKPQILDTFLAQVRERHENELAVSLLKIGQDLRLFVDVSPELLQSLIVDKRSRMRLNGLSLCVNLESPSQLKKAIPNYVISLLKAFIVTSFYTTDAGYRNEVHGYLRQFINRVRSSSHALNRELKKTRDENVVILIESKISELRQFIEWFVAVLLQHMSPGKPYHCCVSALNLYKMLIEAGADSRVSKSYCENSDTNFAFSIDLYNDISLRMLLDNIANNYDEIRQQSTTILLMSPVPLPYDLENRCTEMIKGMKAKEGDTGSRICQLAFSNSKDKIGFIDMLVNILKQEANFAKHDLGSAVLDHSIHGGFSAIKCVFTIADESVLKDIRVTVMIKEVLKCVFDIWEVVKPTLCHDSPEGHLGNEFELLQEREDVYGSATKVVNNYCWRAVKEASGMLEYFLKTLPAESLPNSLITTIGDLLMAQLSSVSHRGAFSAVYPAFVACCRRCNSSQSLSNLPKQWLEDNLKLVVDRAQNITRRSGGLPYLITGVLVADCSLVSSVFTKLTSIAFLPAEASEKTDLPQVHAFNCIRVIFIESELSDHLTPLVDNALALSISSFSNDVWAIRNCAVMLFTSLQNRLFGTARILEDKDFRVSMPAKIFFTRYKGVRPLVIEHLKSNTFDQVETVYPVLSLLSRLGGTEGYDGLDEIKQLVFLSLSSSLWKVREISARTLVAMFTPSDVAPYVAKAASNLLLKDQNKTHGMLLMLKEVSNKFGIAAINVESINSQRKELLLSNTCAVTLRAYIRLQTPDILAETINMNCSTAINCISSAMREVECEIAAAKLSSQMSPELVCEILQSEVYEVQLKCLEALKFCPAAVDELVSNRLWLLFTEGDWPPIRSAALEVFSHYAELTKVDYSVVWTVLYEVLQEVNVSERIRDAALQAFGFFSGKLKREDKLLKFIAKASHEDESLNSRTAALKSLQSYLKLEDSLTGWFQILLFTSDDDPSLREMTETFLAAMGIDGEKGLIAKLNQSKLAQKYWTRLLLSGRLDQEPLPASKQLADAMKPDMVLFAKEKQNLYRDEIGSLILYGQQIAHADEYLKNWAIGAVQQLSTVTNHRGESKAFGWDSEGHVFLLLLRMIIAIRIAKVDFSTLNRGHLHVYLTDYLEGYDS